MATNWSAYEAAKEIMGNNKENITEIGSRYPLFTRTVACANNDYLLDILKALPKVTARVVETGLKEMESDADEQMEEAEAPKKAPKKVTPKSKQPVQEDDLEEEDETESEYDGMTGKELYALCCERGISSLCKSRSKDYLIDLLTKLDNGEIEPASAKKKGAKAEPKKSTKAKAKKAEPVEEAEDDWGDEEEEEEDSDPYAGKNARELFDMCKERGIKAKPKQKADVYVKLLKKADEAEAADDEDEDDDDEWEI